MLGTLLGLIVLAIIFGILYLFGVVIPRSINENFAKNYGGEVWTKELAIVEGLCLTIFLLFINESGFGFWFSLLATVASYGVGIHQSYTKAKAYGAGPEQIFMGVLAQILASGSFAFAVLIVIALLLNLFGKKSKR